ncbi:hypothetical protein, partial [Tenacibaculum discolor]|uniref:hypothetical protein n=1 Tax=Tenacibaculum discolor TaxID=361581 RepID=UPI00159B98DD
VVLKVLGKAQVEKKGKKGEEGGGKWEEGEGNAERGKEGKGGGKGEEEGKRKENGERGEEGGRRHVKNKVDLKVLVPSEVSSHASTGEEVVGGVEVTRWAG